MFHNLMSPSNEDESNNIVAMLSEGISHIENIEDL